MKEIGIGKISDFLAFKKFKVDAARRKIQTRGKSVLTLQKRLQSVSDGSCDNETQQMMVHSWQNAVQTDGRACGLTRMFSSSSCVTCSWWISSGTEILDEPGAFSKAAWECFWHYSEFQTFFHLSHQCDNLPYLCWVQLPVPLHTCADTACWTCLPSRPTSSAEIPTLFRVHECVL